MSMGEILNICFTISLSLYLFAHCPRYINGKTANALFKHNGSLMDDKHPKREHETINIIFTTSDLRYLSIK